MTLDEVRRLANRVQVDAMPRTAEVLRVLADIAELAKKYRPHNHSATFSPNCKLCQALSDLEALKP